MKKILKRIILVMVFVFSLQFSIVAYADEEPVHYGWYQESGNWYYYNQAGEITTGWQLVNGDWYYLYKENDPNGGALGVMAADTKIDRYILSSNGAMLTGWYLDNGNWLYVDPAGYFAAGWRYIDNVWYYLDPENENKMVVGWKIINGQWYYFYTNGAMASNWLLLGEDWYYLGSDGAMKTGWQNVNGTWYYLYTVNDPHGGAEGVMAKNTSIDGYALWPSGAMVSAADIAARNLLDQIGWSLEAAFNWSTSFPYSSTSSTPAPGSEWFANYGFQNGTGDCYVKAATFYYMARQMGYDAHQVAGFVPTAGGGMEDHSWVEIGMEDGIYVFDPSYAQTGRNGYQIYYGMSGTWRYMNYYRMN